MTRITFIKSDPEHKQLLVGVDNGMEKALALEVRESTYESHGSPERFSLISDEALCDFVYDDELLRARRRAVRILSLSDKTLHELRLRLREEGFSREAASAALEFCVERGYVDERRQLERLVEQEANRKLRGRYYIKQKLAAKGFARDMIDSVIDTLVEQGEIDFSLNFEKFKEKKGVTDPEKIRALKYRYGYEN